jgi:hypothetical protein
MKRILGENAEDVVFAQDLVGRAVDLDFGAAVFADEHAVADFDFEGLLLAFVVDPVPTATTFASWGFSLAVSGMMIPPFLTSPSSIGCTSTRSPRGRNVGFAIFCLLSCGCWLVA